MIPSLGGGLCQLSNGLYDAALQAGFEIVERHAHSRVVPGSLAEIGRDATVFWNYVDLRFRSARGFRVEASMDAENLKIVFRGSRVSGMVLHSISRRPLHNDGPTSCATCGNDGCYRAVDAAAYRDFGRAAFLLDEFSPEFDRYVQEHRRPEDEILVPVDGRRFRRANYAWSTNGFGKVHQSLFTTARRSYRSRRLASQGAARQRNLLQMYEELAESYARKLKFDVLHVTVSQNLLPLLWRAGHLGGRTFDVLMTSLPMATLQEELDGAHLLHPESGTLGDFRADHQLIDAEAEALKSARKLITAHTAIAELFSDKTVLLDWKKPEVVKISGARNTIPTLVFPSSTVGRKGCYELREALRGLDVKLVILGAVIESPDFWSGFKVEKGGPNWLENADLVVLPAFIEHRPRRLLLAAAAGVPVIASAACGVANVDGVEVASAGDAYALRELILAFLKERAGKNAEKEEDLFAPACN
jgi:glycosyltransferase involved in cell wall biosynthesis